MITMRPQHGALLIEKADERFLPEVLRRKVGVYGDLVVIVLEGKILFRKGVLRVHCIHGADNGIGGGFAAQPDRFFCHLVVPLC